MSGHSTDQPNFTLLVGLAWLVIVGELLWMDWAQTATVLGDSDDAARLVEVRAFLAGRGWFDLHEPRLQPPIGYDTHWSRLIDAGLAGLFLLFHTMADTALAERLMRVVWPLLWIAPAIVGTIAIAWRLAGRAAALVALLTLLFALPAFLQFKPGRIDHHDVQITLTMLTLASAIWADRVSWAAWTAGALSGLALAIGFESLPFIVLAGGVFVVRFVLDRKSSAALARYGLSIALSVALAFVISIGPSHWMLTACDAIAVNSAAPAILGGLALSIAGYRFADERLTIRFIAVLVAVGLATIAFVSLEPRCLGGPLAMIDPAIRPIWLMHVKEMQSLAAFTRINPASGAGIAAYPIAALLSAMLLARDAHLRRDSGFLAAVMALLLAIAMMIVAIRATPYAIWLGIPFVAAALLRLFASLKLASLPARMLVTIPFTPMLLSICAILIVEKIAPARQLDKEHTDDACFEIKNYQPLAQLPAGLVVTDVDWGPFMLALTPHSVLGAPYHRLSNGIVTSHRAFAAPPDKAREILLRAQATYVMTCGSKSPKEQTESERQSSLWTQLAAGNVPSWLEPIPNMGQFGVYRLKP